MHNFYINNYKIVNIKNNYKEKEAKIYFIFLSKEYLNDNLNDDLNDK